ncbi:unnamed protein product [Gongylonema pulchrum]|uniref:Uncharacterized protein n=1 Tax=Gongylonema pulchrum TaxID=637853 RepID=A0A3P6RWG9_9BILA|nr:unnamed protein product [Gongylonema pulchrum]
MLHIIPLKFRKDLVTAGYDASVDGKKETVDSDDEVTDKSVEAQVTVFGALKRAKNDFAEELIKMEQRRQSDSQSNA